MTDENQIDGISKFWDDYQEHGIDHAISEVMAHSENGSLVELEMAVPHLVEEAKERKIDMIAFLTELDAALEKLDASGTDNGTGGVSSDSSDETDQAQDGDESGSSQDADGETEQVQ